MKALIVCLFTIILEAAFAAGISKIPSPPVSSAQGQETASSYSRPGTADIDLMKTCTSVDPDPDSQEILFSPRCLKEASGDQGSGLRAYAAWTAASEPPGMDSRRPENHSPAPHPPYSKDKEKTWWEKREERKPDIYFPHNVHMEIMKQEGDMCMICHSYQPTRETDPEKLRAMTEILNEPLKAMCHDCHVVERRAPWRCDLCHPDKTKIWPEDHKFGYIQHHAETARKDERACRECHLELSFCTDCHFRREISGTGYHPLGYITLHGMEARTMPSNCGRCHNNFYCDDCHRRRE